MNILASCTVTGRSTPSAAAIAHDSVVVDSHAAPEHGAPASNTTTSSIVAVGGGCRRAATQSAAVKRVDGRRSTIRPPDASGAAVPLLARVTAGAAFSVSEMLSGRSGNPLLTTHKRVASGGGSMKGRAHVATNGDTTASGPHDTLATVGCSPAGTRKMLALTQLDTPSATTVMVSRHVAVALQVATAAVGRQGVHGDAAVVVAVPGAHKVQLAASLAVTEFAPHGCGVADPAGQAHHEMHASGVGLNGGQ